MTQAKKFDRAPFERPAVAARARVRAQAFLVAIAGFAVAALGDAGVEAAVTFRAFGGDYLDRSHLTIAPVTVLASASLLLGLAWMRMNARYDDRWFASVARDAAAPARCVPIVVATASFGLTAALGMEYAEQALGGGLPFGGLALFSPAGLGVAAVFAASAASVVAALGAVLRSVVAAFDAIALMLDAVLVWFGALLCRARADARPASAGGARCRMTALIVSRCHGERAPPRSSLINS